MSKHKAKVIIISGPSGAGKTTLLKKLFSKKKIRNSFIQSISCTTRKRRPGEKEGRDYFFISKNKFIKSAKKKFFLEHQKVLDDYYGTPKHFLKTTQQQSKNLIVCIDVKGGAYLKKHFKKDDVVTVFISAPNKKDLSRRLEKRAENKASIEKRIKLAKKELQFIKDYDYLIINQDLKLAVELLENILITEILGRSKQ